MNDLKLPEGKDDNSKVEAPPVNTKPPPLLFSKRMLVAILLFFSYINFQLLRNNMNIAVVEMTSNKTITTPDNRTIVYPPEFSWDSPTVGLITSVINMGSPFSFLNGFIIEKLGGAVSCAASMLTAGLLTLLHPVALYQSFYVFLACRLLTGFFEAGFYASTSEIFARWFPVNERSTLIGYSFNGSNAGVALVYPLCGFLAHTWGWRMVFYVTGASSIIVSLLVLFCVKNNPSQDKKISKKEQEYILQNTGPMKLEKSNRAAKEKFIEVFKPILTSGPVWAQFMLTFTFIWMATMVTACLPLYVKDMTGKESDKVGYLSSIPNAIYIILFPIAGASMDFWKNHSNTSLTKIHKIIMSTSYTFAMILFVCLTFVSDLTTTLVFFVLIQVFTCCIPLLLSIIGVNMAPNHVSHISSIRGSFFSLGSIAAQTTTGFMTKNHTLQEWNHTFYLTSCVILFGAVFFVIFGSSEPQPWSVSPSAKQERLLSNEQLKTKDILILNPK